MLVNDRARSGPRARPVAAALLAAAALAACQGDSLDPGTDEVTGPVLTLAPQTVAVLVAPERDVALGAPLRVTVGASSGSGAHRVARVGATVRVLDAGGAVLHSRTIGDVAIDAPASGTLTRDFELRPSAADVDALGLPDTARYEIHGWALTAGGACAAAVEAAGQRLPCAQLDGVTTATGQRGDPVAVRVLNPHTVSLQATMPPRVEDHEPLVFSVNAASTAAGQLRQVGVAARVRSRTGPVVQLLLGTRDVAGNQADETFSVPFSQILAMLPSGYPVPAEDRALLIEASAFAVHDSGACVAAFHGDPAQRACDALTGDGRIARDATIPVTVAGVEGRTVPLRPGMSTVGDLLVHSPSLRLFASNFDNHTLEVISTANFAAGFTGPGIRVGSQPMGLALNRNGDTVMVANSGGISVSFVPAGGNAEDVARRFEIPRATLYDYITPDTTQVLLDYHNYVDRPQFLAQDASGRLLYSATSTTASPVGTIRVADWKATYSTWSAHFLFPCCIPTTHHQPSNRAIKPTPGYAIANADSLSLYIEQVGPFVGWTGKVIIWDRVPGRRPDQPGSLIQTPPLRIDDALVWAHNAGSDVLAYPGHIWNVPEAIQTATRTAVAGSGNGRFVLFGEFPDDLAGRLMVWSSDDAALNRVEDISDILNNSSDRISAVAMNHDGSLAVGRGENGVYFMDNMLRLKGMGGVALAGGTGVAFRQGAALPPAQQYVYTGSGRSTIQVIEPVHYRVIGEVPIRSTVTGALRAASCAPGAPADCISTVYAVTADGVVQVHVRASHLTP